MNDKIEFDPFGHPAGQTEKEHPDNEIVFWANELLETLERESGELYTIETDEEGRVLFEPQRLAAEREAKKKDRRGL